ncbi:MAG TPA: hypothetical protein DDW42_01600 [Desulfobacteraceae bacterium]|nr:hypothetical protein [Desulfobacteraceae bacterium]
MDLRTYRYLENTTYTALAKIVGVSQNYMIAIANNNMTPSAKLSLIIEKATGRKVLRSDLRPDLWPPEWAGPSNR